MRGGGNMQQMMKQMQKMQKKMNEEQEKLKEEKYKVRRWHGDCHSIRSQRSSRCRN